MQRSQIKIGILAVLSVWIVCFSNAETAISVEQPDFKIIIGEWVRPDGGYMVRAINPDGSVDAGYYNPDEIHVSEANVSIWKGLVKLFIKLQDKGYPGSHALLLRGKGCAGRFLSSSDNGQDF